MQSTKLINIILLVVIAALGLFAYLEPGEKKDSPKHSIATVDTSTLETFTLRNKADIVFEKKEGHWQLAAPFRAPTNEIRVNQLLDISKSGSEAQYTLKPEDLAKFEMDKPKATLVLGNTTLNFGGSDPINMRRYVQNGDTLYLVNDDFFHHLMAQPTDYVDKKLIPENARIKAFEIPGLKASIGEGGKWLREPEGKQPDLAELAILWSTARAIEVRKLDKPVTGDPVKITPTEGNPIDFIIQQREPEVILARPDLGLSFYLPDETAQQLLNLPRKEAEPAKDLGPDDTAPSQEEDPDEAMHHEDMDEDGESAPETGEDDDKGPAQADSPKASTKP